MDWTLADIKSKVRRITARPDTGQLSEADLLDYINNFLVNTLPQDVPDCPAFKTWFTLSVASGDSGAYSLPTTIQRVLPGAWTVTDSDDNEFQVELYTDYALFFEAFPGDYTTTNRPDSVLLFDNVVYVRPLPDDSYTITLPALASNVVLSSDTDTLDDKAWGPLIAYGAARDIHMDFGEMEEAGNVSQAYSVALLNVARKNILHEPVGKRAAPRF